MTPIIDTLPADNDLHQQAAFHILDVKRRSDRLMNFFMAGFFLKLFRTGEFVSHLYVIVMCFLMLTRP